MATIQLRQPSEFEPRIHSNAHQVQFYKDEPFLVRSVAAHLATSLRDGGSVIVLATKAHRGQILEELARMEVPADALTQRFVALEASEALSQFMRDGMPDPLRFNGVVQDLLRAAQSSARSAFDPVPAFGEMVAVLWAEGKREAAVSSNNSGTISPALIRCRCFALIP